MFGTSSIFQKIAEKSYLVRDHALRIDYGLTLFGEPDLKTYHERLEYIRSLAHKYIWTTMDRVIRKEYTHFQEVLTFLYCKDVDHLILFTPQKVRKGAFDRLFGAIHRNNIETYSPEFIEHLKDCKFPKWLFKRDRFYLKPIWDKKGYAVLPEGVILRLKPEVLLETWFLEVFFQLPFARFLHLAVRKNPYEIDTQDIGNLYLPRLDLAVQQNLKPVLQKLIKQYALLEEQREEYWYNFNGYFWNTRLCASPIEDDFFRYEHSRFWQEINALRALYFGKDSDPIANPKTVRMLRKYFDKYQFILQSMYKEINQEENKIHQVLYEFYGFSASEIQEIEKSKPFIHL